MQGGGCSGSINYGWQSKQNKVFITSQQFLLLFVVLYGWYVMPCILGVTQ